MDYLAKIKQKDEEFSELDKRMQADADLVYLKKYVMTDRSGKHAVPDIINTTLNKPSVFATQVISALGSVKQQVTVEADTKKVDTHLIEDALDSLFRMANERNRRLNIPQLNPAADIGLCIRGRAARRILFRMENGVLVPDAMNLDGRYLRYEMGDEDLDWTSFTTTRTKDQIEAEYGFVIKEEATQVRDVWDKEHNEIWIGDKKHKEQPNPWGFVPVVLSIVSLGYGDVLLDNNRIAREGESIFYMIREAMPSLNMLVSILQTLNFLSVKRPMNEESKEGRDATPVEYDEAIRPGAITAADIGGGLKPIDFGDATRAAQMAYQILEKGIQEGSYTDIDIGNVQQPFSAIALITIGEAKDQMYLPRLAGKEWLNIDTAQMIIRQLLQIGGSLEIGTRGHEKNLNTAKLDGEYTIDYKYYVKSAKTDLGRMSMAKEALSMGIDRETVYSDIMQYEDVEGMLDRYYSQLMETLSPNVLRHRAIVRALNKAEETKDEELALEAKILATDMGLELAQVKAGLMNPVRRPAETSPGLERPTIPLLPPGGRVGGTKPAIGNKPEPVLAGTAI